MPFLTEEIWSVLPQKPQGFVALAAYPKPSDYPSDPLVLREIADVQEAVTEVRRIRADMELGYKIPLVLRVGNESLRVRLEAHSAAISDMCNATAEPLGERPKGYATAMVRGEEIVIPLEGVVDFRTEIARIDKVLVKVDKDVGDLEKRLSNEGFVARAPVEVVDEMREKLRNAAARRSALVVSRERLQAAL
jgi:valyl-tRNA synthetase